MSTNVRVTMRGQAKEWWDKLSDDDLEQIDGKRDKLVALLQACDGDSREKAEEELERLAAV